MSNSERITYGNIVEAVADTNPGGTLLLKNTSGVNLTNNRTGIESAIINNLYATKMLTPGNVAADLTVNAELIYGGYEEEWRSLFRSNYSTALAITASTISADSSDNSLNGSATTEFTNAVAGQIVRVSGFTGAGATTNAGYARISSKPSNAKIILAGMTLTTDAAGESVTVKGQMMIPASTPVYLWNELYNIESTLYRLGRSTVKSAQMTLGLDAMISGSFAHLVQSWTAGTSSGFSGSTAAASTLPVDTVNNIQKIWIDDAVTTDVITSIDFTADNGGAGYYGLGNKFASKIYPYGVKVSGNIEQYQLSNTLATKHANGTEFSLAFVTQDPAGNAKAFHFPKCVLLNDGVAVPGQRGVIKETFSFGCRADTTLGYIMAVNKIAA